MFERKIVRMVDKRLGELLIERRIVNEDQLSRALQLQENNRLNGGSHLSGEILIKLGFVSEDNIVEALSIQYHFPYIPVKQYDISKEVAGTISSDIARKFKVVPIEKCSNVLSIVMSNPLDKVAIKAVEDHSNCNVQVFISSKDEITSTIEKVY